jgi:hypothetical protein
MRVLAGRGRVRRCLILGGVLAAVVAPSATAATVDLPATQEVTTDGSQIVDCPRGSEQCLSSGERILARFDLSGLPVGASITSATLRLEEWDGPYGGTDASVFPITSSWDASVTSPSALFGIGYDSFAASPFDETNETVSEVIHAADVTSVAQQWKAGTRTNYGLIIRDAQSVARFSSFSTGTTTAILRIDYL